MIGVAGGIHLIALAQCLELRHMLLGHVDLVIMDGMDNICIFTLIVVVQLVACQPLLFLTAILSSNFRFQSPKSSTLCLTTPILAIFNTAKISAIPFFRLGSILPPALVFCRRVLPPALSHWIPITVDNKVCRLI